MNWGISVNKHLVIRISLLQFGIGVDGNEGVLISVANPEVGTAVAANTDLLPGAPVSFFLAWNDVTVGSSRHAGVKGHIQVPGGEDEVHFILKTT